MSAKPEPLMTTPEVAEFLRVPVNTLEQWRSRNVGPTFLRLNGRSVRYRPADLRQWLSENESGAA